MRMPTLTLGIVTDLHFGPEAHFRGKLRKLTHHAASLTEAFVDRMNREVMPDLIVNLGDDIEDESREADLVRYAECQSILRKAHAPLINVAGNHDLVNLTRSDLLASWHREGPLYYALDHGEWHLVVLHTIERKDQDIRIPRAQLDWLREDLQKTTRPTIVFMHHSASEQDVDDSRWFSGRPELALVHERADLRAILEESKKVRAVFNGHLHRNHFDVIHGIPYITIQSLIENLDDDAPGRPSAAHAIVRLTPERIIIRIQGPDPARYQIEL
ncbi:metallophosphoesterase [Pendulispora brunnea]|uniref:Metallophosphoesterase n=1 Tax=Pendulispora brunnea TaxID=2905690 RepID=A0ABZ2JYK4_9BACT